MIYTKKIYVGIIITIFFAILTSCGSPAKNEKLTELQNAKEQLERNIAMYDETWNIFFTGDTSIFIKPIFLLTNKSSNFFVFTLYISYFS